MNTPWYHKRIPGLRTILFILCVLFLIPFFLPIRLMPGNFMKKRHAVVQRRTTMAMGNAAHTGVFAVQGVRRFGLLLWSLGDRKFTGTRIIADEDTVYLVDTWEKPHAFDSSTGKLKWSFDENGVITGPMIVDDAVYAGTSHNDLYVIDRKTGRKMNRWHWLSIDSVPITSPLTAEGNSIYFGTGAGLVFSIDIDTGGTNWKFKTEGVVTAAPAAAAGMVYVASPDGRLYALAADEGEVKWTFSAKGPLESSPVVAGGLVLFRNENGNLSAVNAETGALEWNFAVNSETRGAPAVLDDTAFFGDETGRLFAVDVRTGAEKWHLTLEGGIYGAAVIADGVVYFGSRDKHVYAIEASNGELLWQYETNAAVDASPALADDLVVAADTEGTIYAISQQR